MVTGDELGPGFDPGPGGLMRVLIDFTGPLMDDTGGLTYARYVLPLWSSLYDDELRAVFSRGQVHPELAGTEAVFELPGHRTRSQRTRLIDLHLGVRRAVRAHQADVAVFPGNFMSLTIPKRLPTVAMIRSTLTYHYPTQVGVGQRLYRHAALTATARRADRVVVPSSAMADDVMRRLGGWRRRIVVIPHGVDLERFRPDPEVERTPGRFLFVSKLFDYKGFETAIRALALLRRNRSDLDSRLVVADGGGPWTDSWMPFWTRMAAALGVSDRITYLGRLDHDDLALEYRRASALVCPTSIESFGNMFLEAAASGCPVITTSAQGIDETIGPVATQIRAHRHDELADAMAELTTLDEASLTAHRDRLREWASRFPWERTVEETRSVVSELA